MDDIQTSGGRARHAAPRHERRRARRAGRVVLALLLVLVLACAGLAFALFQSVSRLHQDSVDVSTSYASLKADMASFDIDAVRSDAQAIERAASTAKAESEGPVWSIATLLPAMGDDVACVRTLASVGERLSSGVTSPLVDRYGALFDDGVLDAKGDISSTALVSHGDDVSALGSAISDAQAVSSQCESQLDQLGTSHFDELNDTVSKAKKNVSALGLALDALAPAFSGAGSLASIASTVSNLL